MQKLVDRIAVPTTGRTVVEARDQVMTLNSIGVPVIELRLDAIRDLSVRNMDKILIPGLKSMLLATNRRIEEAFPDSVNFGFKGGSEGDRIFYLKRFSYRTDMVDVELNAYFPISQFARAKEVASVHFQVMPPDETLWSAYREASSKAEVGIVKICPTSRSWEDSRRFLRFTESVAQAGGKPIIAPAMNPTPQNGEKPEYYGEIVRVLTLFYGGHYTFARIGEGSAPGQIAYEEMPGYMANAAGLGVPDLAKIDGEGLRQYAGKIGLRT